MAYTTIKKPSDYFNTKLYTGNGGTLNVTGVGFQPDLVWQKCRSIAYNHNLYDVIRGANAHLRSNLTTAEASPSDGLTSFNSDGYTMVQGGAVEASNSGVPYATWNWKAGGTASSNTDGSITSNVSANTTSGFSIVSYTGTGSAATIGHSLGIAPAFIIVKNRSSGVQDWRVGSTALGWTKRLSLNTTGGSSTSSNTWNDTAPTSSVFTVNTDDAVNGSGNSIIAYCFAEKKGFSKFGIYTGNGSTDGTFVYTGFKPAFIIVKRTDSATDWIMVDNKRAGYNSSNYRLYPNTSSVEDTGFNIDLMSNGFKNTKTNSAINASGGTYIYMAFAEEPLVGDNPATAR